MLRRSSDCTLCATKFWRDEVAARRLRADLVKALRGLGYVVDRQKGSHLRVTTQQGGEHHEVIPNHHPIKTGTLSSILKSVAAHQKLSVEELLRMLAL